MDLKAYAAKTGVTLGDITSKGLIVLRTRQAGNVIDHVFLGTKALMGHGPKRILAFLENKLPDRLLADVPVIEGEKPKDRIARLLAAVRAAPYPKAKAFVAEMGLVQETRPIR